MMLVRYVLILLKLKKSVKWLIIISILIIVPSYFLIGAPLQLCRISNWRLLLAVTPPPLHGTQRGAFSLFANKY